MALHVKIITPNHIAFEGEARSIVLPAFHGEMEVLPGHAQYAALLHDGIIKLALENGTAKDFASSGSGLVDIVKDRITVFIDRESV